MGKRFWSLVLSLALVGGVLSALPAVAQEAAPAIPEVANIEDPFGDANTLTGDQVTPVDGGSQTDIGKVWFTHDADNLNVHFLTEGPPNANSLGFQFVVTAGEAGCLVIDGFFDGSTYTSENLGRVVDNCNKLDQLAEGTSFTFGPAPAGTGGLATITVPRSYSPLFADGSVIAQPKASTWIFVGGQQVYDATKTYRGVRQRIDDTKVGTDYAITGGGPVVEPEPDPTVAPPGKNDPPGKGKKKGCSKGKGKKKGACPGGNPGKPEKPGIPDAPASCTPFVPGDMGKDAETTVVTDAATKEKPISIPVPLGPATGRLNATVDRSTRMKHNVQVDTAAAETGLWIRLEAPPADDPDLYAFWPSGKQAAVAGGFNPLLAGGPLPKDVNDRSLINPNGTGSGGHSEFTAEQIDGLKTADCQGWTLDLVNWAGRGGYTLKLWVGEAQNDPAPEQEAEALVNFYGLTGMVNPSSGSVKASPVGGTPAATNGCTKGKGKKKGCTKPPVQSCASITAAPAGAEKPTVVVTDEATAEKPLEQTIKLAADFDEGLNGDAPNDAFNVQVDSAAATAGLYVTFQFQPRRDYDLWTYWSDGSVAASSHGFNPVVEAKTGPPVPWDLSNTKNNHAGESKADSENIVGLITRDCGGYTLGFENYFGEGGEFKVKVWLGEGKTDPKPQGEETR